MKKTSVARSKAFGVFQDNEVDWVFRRTLEHTNEKAAEIGECLYVARKINEKNGDSWITHWADLAQRVELQAIASYKNGSLHSAKNAFLRASNYYRTAEYGTPPSNNRFDKLWNKSKECFQKACSIFEPKIQKYEILFDGKKLSAYFWSPDDKNIRRPTLFAVGGNDTSLEEVCLMCGFAAIRRGYNFFTFDFPGHRGAVHKYHDCIKRYDMEVPFKPAFDFLEKLPGVDDRIALTGFSFGGYIVSRVAIYEPRVKAVIPNSPIVDLYEISAAFMGDIVKLKNLISKIPPYWLEKIINAKLNKFPLRKAFKEYTNMTAGMQNASIKEKLDIIDKMQKEYSIKEQLKEITCPALALIGEDEGDVMIKQAEDFLSGISSSEKQIYKFSLEKDGSNDHCQLDNRSRSNEVMFNWLDNIF